MTGSSSTGLESNGTLQRLGLSIKFFRPRRVQVEYNDKFFEEKAEEDEETENFKLMN